MALQLAAPQLLVSMFAFDGKHRLLPTWVEGSRNEFLSCEAKFRDS